MEQDQQFKCLNQAPQDKSVGKRQKPEKPQPKTPYTTIKWERHKEQCHPPIVLFRTNHA
jgi:hypothetical protein